MSGEHPYRIKFLPSEDREPKLNKAHDIIDTYTVVESFVKSKEKKPDIKDFKVHMFWILVILTISPLITLVEFLIARAIWMRFP